MDLFISCFCKKKKLILKFQFLASNFINNTDIFIPTYDYLQLIGGGACLFQGKNLNISKSYFQRNSGFLGGAIVVAMSYYDFQLIEIYDSMFKQNFAGHGAAIGFSLNILETNTIIKNNIFDSNEGLCRI